MAIKMLDMLKEEDIETMDIKNVLKCITKLAIEKDAPAANQVPQIIIQNIPVQTEKKKKLIENLSVFFWMKTKRKRWKHFVMQQRQRQQKLLEI